MRGTLLVHQSDLNGDTRIDGADLGLLLGNWDCAGDCCIGDLNGDQITNGADLGILLGHYDITSVTPIECEACEESLLAAGGALWTPEQLEVALEACGYKDYCSLVEQAEFLSKNELSEVAESLLSFLQ